MPSWVNADLHIHTTLSPCAEPEMTPANVVSASLASGLQVIAVTDHNSAGNVKPFMRVGEDNDLIVIPGMELQTREEVHLVCLFASLDAVSDFSDAIYSFLPARPNQPAFFGEQNYVDEFGDIVGSEPKLLINSVEINIDDAFAIIRENGGLCIPAHVDRPSYSILANLGFIPLNPAFDALEISSRVKPADLESQLIGLSGYRLIRSSDAHRICEIGLCRTVLEVEEYSVQGVLKAITRLEGGPPSGWD